MISVFLTFCLSYANVENSDSAELGLVVGLKLPKSTGACLLDMQKVISRLSPFDHLDVKQIEKVEKALESVSYSLKSVPNEISSCKPELHKDCNLISETFKFFNNPSHHGLVVNGSVILNSNQITENLLDIQSHLNNKDYYHTSLNLGQLVRKMLVRENAEQIIEDFFEGLLIGLGLTSNVKKCLKNPETSIEQIKEGLKNLESRYIWTVANGIKKISLAVLSVIGQVKACEASPSAQILKIEKALNILMHPFRYKLIITKDILFNGVSIKTDLANARSSLAAGYYYDFGYDIGHLVSKFES